VDLKGGVLHVRRVKQGTPATHPLTGRELRALRRLERETAGSPFVFFSERGAPFAARGFQAMVERAGNAAGFDMKIHPHMLRHACGYKLANEGVDTRTIQGYLGHKSIQHTCATQSWRPLGLRDFGGTNRSEPFSRSFARCDRTWALLDTLSREAFVRYFQCFNRDFIGARLEAGAFDLIHPGILEMPTLQPL